MDPRQINLHTHSFYCKHGSGTVTDFVNRAVECGIKILGMSEHCPLPGDWYHPNVRMDYAQLSDYASDVRAHKDRNDIKVLLGAECDWIESEVPYYRDELLGKRGFDYLIGGIHFMFDPVVDKEVYLGRFSRTAKLDLSLYVSMYTKMLSTGIFLFGAHPDLYMAGCESWTKESEAAAKDIISCAIDCNIPLELNGYGLLKGPSAHYPMMEFWEIARDMGAKIIVNSDAHRPENVLASLAFELADELKINLFSYQI